MIKNIQPKVSVLMNCYNSSRYLAAAIESVYSQSYKNFEIIFVDNHSTDGSAEIAQSYDQRLKYFRTPHFMKLYEARSYGLQFINGDYLAFLDCDDLWMPGKLEHQIRLLSEKKADFVYGGFKLKFETQTFKSFLLTRLTLFLNLIRRTLKRSRARSIDSIIKNYDINLQTAIFDFKKSNGLKFNPRLNLLGDLDFFFQLGISRNFSFYYDKTIVANYRIHENQLSGLKTRNWVLEGRYCSLFLYRNILSTESLEQFRKLVEFFHGNDLWERDKKKQSLIVKKRLRFRNSTMFLDWLKYSFKYLITS
jgi:glycosyltransferase involved in cell wall biosynthesis